MKVSAVSVVRNEQDNIQNMLNSLKHKVDEVVIVDQMSEDKTRNIAETFCFLHNIPLVYTMDQKIGYAELSRQKAMELAQYERILVIDADERLVAEDLDTYSVGYYNLSRLTTIRHNGVPVCSFVSYQMRLVPKGTKHSDKIHTMPKTGKIDGVIRKALLEEKSASETLKDYIRYEQIQSRKFQQDMINFLIPIVYKNDIPNEVWHPQFDEFWLTPDKW